MLISDKNGKWPAMKEDGQYESDSVSRKPKYNDIHQCHAVDRSVNFDINWHKKRKSNK